MSSKIKVILILCLLNLMLAASAQAGVIRDERGEKIDLIPTGKGWGVMPPPDEAVRQSSVHSKRTTNGIDYHGGPLILGTTNVYYIWYGNWGGNSATTILGSFVPSLSGSPYYNINTTYYNGSNTKVTNAVAMPHNNAYDSYSKGSALSDSDIQTIVAKSISSGTLPLDSNAVYYVLTSADVNETSGFCTQYCGWHTHGTILGLNGISADIKYSFVGNPDRCPSACEAQATGPNGNAGADAMASVIAHELEEAVTDPDLNAWYDNRGEENADKCAWKFGTTYPVNGALANMQLGGLNYLVQQNWVNANGGYCSLIY